MNLKIFLKGVPIILVFVTTSLAFKYDIVMRDENIFSPCDDPELHYLEDYIDVSNMNFETLANGSVNAKGYIVFIRDLGMGNNPATIQLFKKQRDRWVNTIYNLERLDACNYIFDRNEVWASVLDYIPEEHRKCPFYKGQILHFDVVTDMSVHIPNPQFAGVYMVQIKVKATELNETFCTNMFTEIYRA